MGVDFELPTVKNYVFKLLLFPELFFKIFIMVSKYSYTLQLLMKDQQPTNLQCAYFMIIDMYMYTWLIHVHVSFSMQFLAAAGIVLMVEFGFNEFSPTLFCNEDGAAFRFCLNSIACNAVVIVVSAFLIFVDLLRACLTNKQVWIMWCYNISQSLSHANVV